MIYYPSPVFVSKKLFKIIKKEGLLIRKTPDKKFWIVKNEDYGRIKICVCKTTSWRKMKRISRSVKLPKNKEIILYPYEREVKE